MNNNSTVEAKKPEILIVDDLPNNVTLLKYILNTAGYRHRAASDGTSALQAIAQKKPDLVLLDLMMPDMSGYEVCAHLRDNHDTKYLPVIIITAHESSPASKVRGLQMGANDYVTKPIAPDELIARIETQLQLKRQADQRVLAEKNAIMVLIQQEIEAPLSESLDRVEHLLGEIDCDESSVALVEQMLIVIRDSKAAIKNFIEDLQNDGKDCIIQSH